MRSPRRTGPPIRTCTAVWGGASQARLPWPLHSQTKPHRTGEHTPMGQKKGARATHRGLLSWRSAGRQGCTTSRPGSARQPHHPQREHGGWQTHTRARQRMRADLVPGRAALGLLYLWCLAQVGVGVDLEKRGLWCHMVPRVAPRVARVVLDVIRALDWAAGDMRLGLRAERHNRRRRHVSKPATTCSAQRWARPRTLARGSGKQGGGRRHP